MLWYFLLYYYLNISRYRFWMIFMLIALTCTTYLYIASHFPSLSHPFPLSLSLSLRLSGVYFSPSWGSDSAHPESHTVYCHAILLCPQRVQKGLTDSPWTILANQWQFSTSQLFFSRKK